MALTKVTSSVLASDSVTSPKVGVEFTTSSVLTAAAINNMDIYSRVHVWGWDFRICA